VPGRADASIRRVGERSLFVHDHFTCTPHHQLGERGTNGPITFGFSIGKNNLFGPVLVKIESRDANAYAIASGEQVNSLVSEKMRQLK